MEEDAIEYLKTIVPKSDDKATTAGSHNDPDGMFKRATAILCLGQINSPAANDALFNILIDHENTPIRACGLGVNILLQTSNPKIRDVLVSAAQKLDANEDFFAKQRATRIRKALDNKSV